VGRRPLVQPDQLVDLGPRQPTAAPHKIVEPRPLGPVRRDEDVDIHGR